MAIVLLPTPPFGFATRKTGIESLRAAAAADGRDRLYREEARARRRQSHRHPPAATGAGQSVTIECMLEELDALASKLNELAAQVQS
ncbi:MAG: hypothetical protein N2483_08730, partial [Burkholderiaceae bacterium]|nr:hypothetical protein [Burkholderiaceae bacterium]